MQIKIKSFLLLACFATSAYAGYDQQCLSDCFSSGHECKYCAWQCYSDKAPYVYPNTNTPCPLDNKGQED